MSRRVRGSEVSIRFSVEGEPLRGSFLNVSEFSVTERADLNEISYLGEKSDDIDYQHHGFDFSFKVDVADSDVMTFMDSIISAEKNAEAHPEIVMTVLYQFRNAETPKVEAYHGVYMRANELSFGGRKEAVSGSFEGKARERVVISQ